MEVISLYEMEIPSDEVLYLMKNNIYNHYEKRTFMNIDKNYTSQRETLISLIYKITSKMGLKSQTFFMAINYLDIIFSKHKNFSYNYTLLSLACIIVASKYSGKVSIRPLFKYYINLYKNEIQDNTYKLIKNTLLDYEVIVCKLLNYKLNYYSIYDFNYFFFGNGIIKIEQLNEINCDYLKIKNEKNSSKNIISSSKIKKVLIKIYERSRYYLDSIIENLICLKYGSLIISICIIEKSIDYVLLNEYNLENIENTIEEKEIRNKNKKYFKEIMNDFYKIDYESLPEYQYLKIDIEKFKLFDELNNNNDNINLFQNQNLTHENLSKQKMNYNINNNYSTNNINEMKNTSFQHSSIKKYNDENYNSININETKNKINYLYKKVNVKVFGQNNKSKKININQIRKKNYKRKDIDLRKVNFLIDENENENSSSNIIPTTNFYQKGKNQNNLRNCISAYKNNNFINRCNTTSSSPFNKKNAINVLKLNSLTNKSRIANKIRDKKRFNGSEERLTINSNSIDKKKSSTKYKNNLTLKNIKKPYIKKIIQNYDKTQIYDNNQNENNITNNKIIYKIKNRYIGNNFNSISLNNSIINRNNNLYKSKILTNENSINNSITFESSPFIKRNASNSKNNYSTFNFRKKFCQIKDNNSDFICINQIKNNYINDYNKNQNGKYNDNKIITNFNLYKSNISSRKFLQFNNPKNKSSYSSININNNSLNSDKNDMKNNKSITINDYNIDIKRKIYKKINFERNNENINNNTKYDSNFVKIYKNKKHRLFNYYNVKNNIKFNPIGKNKLEIEKVNYIDTYFENNDRKIKYYPNNIFLNYSTGIY